MIKEFCKAWETNKGELEGYFRTIANDDYFNYVDIVLKLFELVINPYVKSNHNYKFDMDKMTCINDGDYQGTLIFVIPKDTYQPFVDDYVFTSVYYGSCSCCDTLQAILDWDLSSDEQIVSDLMALSLHLLERCNWMVRGEVE